MEESIERLTRYTLRSNAECVDRRQNQPDAQIVSALESISRPHPRCPHLHAAVVSLTHITCGSRAVRVNASGLLLVHFCWTTAAPRKNIMMAMCLNVLLSHDSRMPSVTSLIARIDAGCSNSQFGSYGWLTQLTVTLQLDLNTVKSRQIDAISSVPNNISSLS